jgi:hypothetical protein
MSSFLDRVDSSLHTRDHILKKADRADPSTHETTQDCAYHEHYPDWEPREEPVLEEKRDRVHCASYLGLRLHTRNDWEHNPRTRPIEGWDETHDANSAKEHKEAKLNDCSDWPVVPANLEATEASSETSCRLSLSIRDSLFLHLSGLSKEGDEGPDELLQNGPLLTVDSEHHYCKPN